MAQGKTRPVRGATLNEASTRFNLPAREDDGDWRDAQEAVDGAPPPPRTSVTVERPKTIITRNRSPDVPFDRSINAYRGCEQPYTVARPIVLCDLYDRWHDEPACFALTLHHKRSVIR